MSRPFTTLALLGRLVLPIDLPVSGLRVDLPDPPEGAHWAVTSRWDEAHAEDRLALVGAASGPSYTISVAGRTDRDCPLANSFPVELSGQPWIEGDLPGGAPPQSARSVCRALPEARLLVTIDAADAVHLPDHAPVLTAILDALVTRRVSDLPPPAPDRPIGGPTALPTTGLALDLPGAARWRVAAPIEGRVFDALVREVPALPEVQVAIRRHDRALLPSCEELLRRLLTSSWRAADRTTRDRLVAPPPGWQGVLEKRIGRFESRALCRELPGSLLDVRVAMAPDASLDALAPVLDALAAAREVGPLPPPEPRLGLVGAARSEWAVLVAGASWPGRPRGQDSLRRGDSAAIGALEVGLTWMERNGPALAGAASLGLDGQGATIAAHLEAGVALAIDRELTFLVALGLLERRDALMANRALFTSFELRAGHFEVDRLAWSLRVVPFLLASREPAITGLPLELTFQAILPGGIALGLELRAVSRPTAPTERWPADGLALGARIGFGAVSR